MFLHFRGTTLPGLFLFVSFQFFRADAGLEDLVPTGKARGISLPLANSMDQRWDAF
jgi:hypothetical protein